MCQPVAFYFLKCDKSSKQCVLNVIKKLLFKLNFKSNNLKRHSLEQKTLIDFVKVHKTMHGINKCSYVVGIIGQKISNSNNNRLIFFIINENVPLMSCFLCLHLSIYLSADISTG